MVRLYVYGKMDPTLADFFLFISKIINFHNPLLIIADKETFPMHLCNGSTFPAICSRFSESESDHLVKTLMDQTTDIIFYPIFLSDGGHETLVTRLSKYPILFSLRQTWVVPMRYAKNLPLRLDNNIFFYDGNASAGYNVYESYAIKGKNPVTKMLFQWHYGEESIPLLSPTMDRRSNLNGVVLRDSWVDPRNESRVVHGDMFYDIMLTLEERLNFTFEFVSPKPGKFGKRFPNGTWNGIVGMLIEDDIDLIAGLMVSEQRLSTLDFTWPIYDLKITLLSSKSQTPRLNAWVYVNVFPVAAWVSGFAILIVAALCFSVSCHETITQSITLMGRLFLQIGYELPIKGYASRGLLMTAALCLNMIFMYYTSDLTANMTASPKEPDVKSFDDVEQLGYKVYGPPEGRLTANVLKNAPEESAMKRIYQNKYIIVEDLQQDMEGLAKKMIDGEIQPGFIWTFPRNNMKNLIALDVLEAVDTPKTLAFNKDSELFALFNHEVLKMIESGITTKIVSSNTGNPKEVYGISDAIVIGYENLLFPFAWLALGSIIALPIMWGELILCKFNS